MEVMTFELGWKEWMHCVKWWKSLWRDCVVGRGHFLRKWQSGAKSFGGIVASSLGFIGSDGIRPEEVVEVRNQ